MCNRDKSVHGLNKCGSNLHIAHLLAVEITALQGELLIVHEAKLLDALVPGDDGWKK